MKPVCAAILVFMVSFSFALGVCAASITMERHSQNKSKWCWAACALMLARSQGADFMTQSDIVTYVKGSAVNEMGTVVETEQAVRYIANNSFSTIKGTDHDTPDDDIVITNSAIKNKINAGYPIIFGVQLVSNNTNGGHMVLGYDYFNIAGGLFVDYHDPSDTDNGNDTSGYFSYNAITSSEGTFMYSQGTEVYLTAYISVME